MISSSKNEEPLFDNINMSSPVLLLLNFMTNQLSNSRTGFTHPCWVVTISLGCLFCVSASSVLFAGDDQVTGQLIVEDILARPGTPAMLKARLVQNGLLGLTGLGGETITFVVQGQRAGTALTGGDGRAFLEFKTHMRGNQQIVAKVELSPRVKGVTGLGNFASWERRRPILFVDVRTLRKAEAPGVVSLPVLPLLNPIKLGQPDEDAPRELMKLGEFYYNIVYLFRGDRKTVESLRDWLTTAQFPSGITRAIQPGPAALLAFIKRLEDGGWDHVQAGIGQTQGFAETLVKRRIKAVIFADPAKHDTFPRRTKIVSTWKEVRKHL